MLLHGLAAGLRRLAGAALVALVAACGGGGGDGNTPPGGGGTTAPQITTQPQAASVDDGATASFSVTASGTTLAYQWQRNGADIAGATSATFALAPATLADDGASFRVVVSNGGGSVTSNGAALTVRAVAPVIGTQPQSIAVDAGATASFSVSATGSQPLAYQWRRNGADIAGATAAGYTTPAVASGDDGAQFDVVVRNAGGSVTSAAATLSVRSAGGTGGTRLSLGRGHAVAVRADGSVIAWGANNTGQLGSGAQIAGTVARSVAVSAVSVAGGQFESLALGADGIVRGWGTKFGGGTIIGGQADARGTLVPTPVASALPGGITAIVTGTGDSFAFALRSDGTVWVMPGQSTTSDYGATFTTTARQVSDLSGVRALASGAGSTGQVVAIRNDGSVWQINLLPAVDGWQASAAAVAGLPAVTSASCGPNYCMAVASDRSVWGWGTNYYRMLGSGNPTVPVRIAGLSDVIAVATTPDSSHAITADGRLWSWGSRERSGIDVPAGSIVEVPTPVPGLDKVAEVAGGLLSVLVRRSDGTVWGWGDNVFGELGTGTTGGSLTPVQATGINLN